VKTKEKSMRMSWIVLLPLLLVAAAPAPSVKGVDPNITRHQALAKFRADQIQRRTPPPKPPTPESALDPAATGVSK
jgi:hypothetical protein